MPRENPDTGSSRRSARQRAAQSGCDPALHRIHSLEARKEAQVLSRRQLRVQLQLVSEQAQARADAGAGIGGRHVPVPDGAARRAEQRRDDREKGGFSGAVRPEEAEDVAACCGEADPGERPPSAEGPRDLGEGHMPRSPPGSRGDALTSGRAALRVELTGHLLELRHQTRGGGRRYRSSSTAPVRCCCSSAASAARPCSRSREQVTTPVRGRAGIARRECEPTRAEHDGGCDGEGHVDRQPAVVRQAGELKAQRLPCRKRRTAADHESGAIRIGLSIVRWTCGERTCSRRFSARRSPPRRAAAGTAARG